MSSFLIHVLASIFKTCTSFSSCDLRDAKAFISVLFAGSAVLISLEIKVLNEVSNLKKRHIVYIASFPSHMP